MHIYSYTFPDSFFWTIAKVCSLINGNHEIIEPTSRFGKVDYNSTLTFADKDSLINVLQKKHYGRTNKHPHLGLSYEEAVQPASGRANLFAPFAFNDNFMDLVNALEFFLERHSEEYPEATTYIYFDPFVNNQWIKRSGLDSTPFDWWANAFRETAEITGHTYDPKSLMRAWCRAALN